MISIGIHPEVSTASSSFMVFFASSTSAFQFALSGSIDYWYGLWLIIDSILASITGVFVLRKVISYYQKTSILVLMLGIVLGIAGILVMTFLILSYSGEEGTAPSVGFKNYC